MWRHFTKKELLGPREATPEVLGALDWLVTHVLDRWRDALGKPLRVTSGYRTVEENERIPGAASDSWHTWGAAVDVAPVGVNLAYAFSLLRGLPFDKAILYPSDGHIHVQARNTEGPVIGANRNLRYRANRDSKGKVTYVRL